MFTLYLICSKFTLSCLVKKRKSRGLNNEEFKGQNSNEERSRGEAQKSANIQQKHNFSSFKTDHQSNLFFFMNFLNFRYSILGLKKQLKTLKTF